MTDEEFDDALDGLSAKKRRQVLRLVSDEERAPRQRISNGQAVGRGFVVLFAFLWSIPFTIAGLACCLAIVTMPIGIILLVIGALPLRKAIKTWSQDQG